MQIQHSTYFTIQPSVFTVTPGVVPEMSEKEPIDYFKLLFNSRVLDLILRETNRYAEQYLEREQEYLSQHPHARAHDWPKTPLSIKEIEVFLALLITMGVCGFPTLRLVVHSVCMCIINTKYEVAVCSLRTWYKLAGHFLRNTSP